MDYTDLLKRFTNKGVKEQSAQSYISKFKRITKDLYDDQINLLEAVKVKKSHNLIAEQILKYVNKEEIPISEKDNILRFFLKCLDALEIDTSIFLEKFQSKLTELKYDKEFQEPTEKEEENKIPKEELIKLRDEYKELLINKFTKNDLYYVLLSLYTYIQPLRSQDYYDSELYFDSAIRDPESKTNYLCLTQKKLVLYNYKTSSIYGPRIITIPMPLIEILYRFKEKTMSPWVICSPKKNKLKANNFNRLFHEACKGKAFSCNMARKCHVSDAVDDNIPIEQRKNDAKIMGHSMSTAQARYSKFSKLFHTDDSDLDALIEQRRLLNKLQKDLDRKILDKLKLIE